MRVVLVLLAVILLAAPSQTLADTGGQQHRQVLQRFLTDDVVGVICVNLGQLDTDSLMQRIKKSQLFDDPSALATVDAGLKLIHDKTDELRAAGVQRAYAFLRADDFYSQGFSWVAPIANDRSPAEAAKQVQRCFQFLPGPFQQLSQNCRSIDGYVVMAASEQQLKRMMSEPAQTPREYPAAMENLFSGTLGIAIFGDRDSRKVVRQLFPSLPDPYSAITGPLVADELDWGGVMLKLGTELDLEMLIQARNLKAAQIVERGCRDGLQWGRQLVERDSVISKELSSLLFEAIEVKRRTDHRVHVSAAKLVNDFEGVSATIAPQLEQARRSARQVAQLNQIRNIALAMHNYESALGSFPARAKLGKDGRSLLSWRVQILPFLEQAELYNQFHHDEPWDSEHNIKLVQKMPEIYADVFPAGNENNQQGRTLFQIPVAAGTLFGAAEAPKFRDVSDGADVTILVGHVARKHAVIWTKPADWEVDLDQPTAKLTDADREKQLFAFVNGSVRYIEKDRISSQLLRALLTSKGGEEIRQ